MSDEMEFQDGEVWEELGTIIIVIRDSEGGYYEIGLDKDSLAHFGFDYIAEGC
jgi:hypothetical protein